ncbi:substance-P receptor [Stomoxys calcitrans]|uniref:G-protein coupled receptors family 1 profile domain-containing protein n=1 Tax=Stomoxys calcitrans TaxID=35570 RepID=A0A1I8PG61_STOCA|nr:substance-P receptor [Stomoxys calcitrans]XP_059216590.1 substance-P receptor [Stomoxys calcitrans]
MSTLANTSKTEARSTNTVRQLSRKRICMAMEDMCISRTINARKTNIEVASPAKDSHTMGRNVQDRKHVYIQQLPLPWWCYWYLVICTNLLFCCSWTHAIQPRTLGTAVTWSTPGAFEKPTTLNSDMAPSVARTPHRDGLFAAVNGNPTTGDEKTKAAIAVTSNFVGDLTKDFQGVYIFGSNETINQTHGIVQSGKTKAFKVALNSSRNAVDGLASRTGAGVVAVAHTETGHDLPTVDRDYATSTTGPTKSFASTIIAATAISHVGSESTAMAWDFNHTENYEEITFHEECLQSSNSLAHVFTVALYSVVCVVGLFGNTLVIWVVFRFSKMQTVTNIYILNLAIADECFLIGIPFLLYTMRICSWKFGEFVCKAYMVSTSITQFTSSIFLLIMAADRYLAVCHPIESPRYRTIRIAKLVSVIAWVTSAVLMMPVILFASTVRQEDGINYSCNIDWPEVYKKHSGTTFILYTFLLGFATPLCFILVFYYLVIRKLHSVQQKHKSKEKKRSHRKVTRLVLTVITVYILCWLPHWVSQVSLINSFVGHKELTRLEILLILLFGCLAYSNSAMNPILYAFLSDNFRKSFTKAFSCVTSHEVEAQLINENSVVTHKRSGSALNKRKGSRRMSIPRAGPTPQNNCFLAPTIVHNSGGGSSSGTSASTATTATDKSSNSNNKSKREVNGDIVCTAATKEGEKITLAVNHQPGNEMEKTQTQTNV